MINKTVLIIDDELDIRELLEITLLRMGLDTVTAGDVRSALEKIEKYRPFLCIAEFKLPDGDGRDIVHYLQKNHLHIPVVLMSTFASQYLIDNIIKVGAYDFVFKPVELPKLRELIQTALKLSAGKGRQATTTDEYGHDHSSGILGNSPAMQQLKATIKKLGRRQASVYIHGETGSGKGLIAQQIHQQGFCAQNPFITVNCGVIHQNLTKKETFEKHLQAAHKGTLFLDNVSDLSPEMQNELLLSLQKNSLGLNEKPKNNSWNIRILSATHKSLEHEVAAGHFRQDLYYRLNVIKLKVPPLRERQDDIMLLADFFLHKIAERWQMPPIRLSPAARSELAVYPFPGNVRELENILERASTLCDNNTIQPDDLQLSTAIGGMTAGNRLVKIVPKVTRPVAHAVEPGRLPAWNPVDEDAERDLILRALDQTRWNRTKAAELLGMTFRQLRYRIQKYGLDEG